jgi:RNA polymerase sigma-70 factor (ECF subfamily)
VTPLAEDATQQTFVQAWRASRSYDPSRSMAAWLTGIARNAAIDVHRRERRHRGTASLDAIDLTLQSQPPSVEQLYAVWEVREALAKLPEQDGELLRLQHFGELTHREIAAKLDIPIGTVKSRSYRAHRRLAGLLGHLRAATEEEGGS